MVEIAESKAMNADEWRVCNTPGILLGDLLGKENKIMRFSNGPLLPVVCSNLVLCRPAKVLYNISGFRKSICLAYCCFGK